MLSKPFESNTHAQSHRMEDPARMRALRREWVESNADVSWFNTSYQDFSKRNETIRMLICSLIVPLREETKVKEILQYTGGRWCLCCLELPFKRSRVKSTTALKDTLDKTVSLGLNKILEWAEEGDEYNLKKGYSGRLKAQQNLNALKKLQTSIELETKATKKFKK